MNLPKHLLLLGFSAVLAGHPARAQMPTPTPPPIEEEDKEKEDKKESIVLLDGKTLFGKVEMTDDYTLRVTHDSGLMKIPLALLGEKDFKKYSSKKDRSNDGRLWSERKDALEKEEKKDAGRDKDEKVGGDTFEIQLKEIAIFQPAIDAYQKLLSDKKSSKENPAKDGETAKNAKKNTTDDDPPFIPLFSQPSVASQLPGPLNAVGGYVQPLTTIGAGAIDATAGAGVGLPTAP